MTLQNAATYIEDLIASERFKHQVAGYHFFAGSPAGLRPVPPFLSPTIIQMLSRLGIQELYTHQVEALENLRHQRHTVVATPTASGKSLIYNVAVCNAVAENDEARALYIYPLKALAQDQMKVFVEWSRAAEPMSVTSAVYDGDTSAYQRKKIRLQPPHVVMTNPEMIHLALLPFHRQWATFFRCLHYVVIDEVHTYRGITGAHMAQVLRRLQRICSFYGSTPTFIFTSATIADPERLAGSLSGLSVQTVEESGAPRGNRHAVIVNPDDSPSQTAILLLKAAMARNLRTIVYTQSRKMAELITIWAQSHAGALAEKISVYRAGLMPQERRVIENKLKEGDLLAVVSTSALELGIDVGDLDICILVGYPGSMMATWQRSGRVGRKGQEAALVVIAVQDALDQYFVSHPEVLWQGRPEHAVVNPLNPVVLESHLVCAAAELALDISEPWLSEPVVRTVVAELEKKGALVKDADGKNIYTYLRRPHMKINLRGAGRTYQIIDMDDNKPMGELDAFRLYREAHPGAIYLHQGRSYLIHSVDEGTGKVMAHAAQVGFYTRVRSDSDVVIIRTIQTIKINKTNIYFGEIKVIDKVLGYDRVQTGMGRVMEHVPLELPPNIFETQAFWMRVDAHLCAGLIKNGLDVHGGLHAAEHGLISMMPLVVLADRNDLGGLSTPYHPQIGSAAIFVYDGLPGGAGLCSQAFSEIAALIGHTIEAIQNCPCEKGCPACVHSPKCGSGNSPIDKQGGILILKGLLPGNGAAQRHDENGSPVTDSPAEKKWEVNHQSFNYGVFDLETQFSAQEVGGWQQAHLMKVSCGVVYDAGKDGYTVYMQDGVGDLIDHLKRFDLVIGFNSLRFDYRVLSGYSEFNFKTLPTLDLLDKVYQQLGFRLSLDHLAHHTLGIIKTGTGLDALKWWQEGRIDQLVAYCRMDVQITRDLYLFARDNGYLIYQDRQGRQLRVPLHIGRG